MKPHLQDIKGTSVVKANLSKFAAKKGAPGLRAETYLGSRRTTNQRLLWRNLRREPTKEEDMLARNNITSQTRPGRLGSRADRIACGKVAHVAFVRQSCMVELFRFWVFAPVLQVLYRLG